MESMFIVFWIILLVTCVQNTDSAIDDFMYTAEEEGKKSSEDKGLDSFYRELDGKKEEFVKFQYDILIRKKRFNNLMGYDRSLPSTRSRRNAINDENILWPNGKIPYKIDDSFNETQKNSIKKAIDMWEQWTCLEIYEDVDAYTKLIFKEHPTECNSFVGMLQGEQPIHLSSTNVAVVVHELGHAIGLYHEHMRHNRDEYVVVNYTNIVNTTKTMKNFEVMHQDKYTNFSKPYDYISIMHYGKLFFSRNKTAKLVTMSPKNKTYLDIIGTVKTLSYYDAKIVCQLYNCAGKCKSTCSEKEAFKGSNCNCICKGPSDDDPIIECPIVGKKQCSMPPVDYSKYMVMDKNFEPIPNNSAPFNHGTTFDIEWIDKDACGTEAYSTIECNNGNWTNELPECFCVLKTNWKTQYKICDFNIYTESGVVDNSENCDGPNEYEHGQIITLSCKSDTKMMVTSQCENGFWTTFCLNCPKDSDPCTIPTNVSDITVVQGGKALKGGMTINHKETTLLKCKNGKEPYDREFKCNGGAWIAKDIDNDLTFENNGAFPQCRNELSCPDLGVLCNGRIIYSPKKRGGSPMAYYECNANTDLFLKEKLVENDDGVRECQMNGQWSGSSELQCFRRSTFNKANSHCKLCRDSECREDVKKKYKFKHGSEIYSRPKSKKFEMYRDEDGYLEKDMIKHKQIDGKWDPPFPICIAARCDINSNSNVKISYINGSDAGPKVPSYSDVIVACKLDTSKHKLQKKKCGDRNDDGTATCTCKMGVLKVPSCKAKKCLNQDLPDILNSQAKKKDKYALEHSAERYYPCYDDYEVRDSVTKTYLDATILTVKCDFGKWIKSESLECVLKRCNVDDAIPDKMSQNWIMSVDGLYLDLEDTMVEHGILVYMNCTNRHDLKNNNEETISMANGTCIKGTLSMPFTCQPKSCEIPDVNHGRILYLTDNQQYVKHNEQLTIECDPKYEIFNNDGQAGDELITTCDKGNWNEKEIICKPKRCNVDDAIPDKVSQVWIMTTDGLYQSLKETMVKHGILVFMNCTNGHDLKNIDGVIKGIANGTCIKGTLSMPFTCQPKSCEKPDVKYGRILYLTENQQYVKHNEQLIIKCDPKYEIFNNDSKAGDEMKATCDKGNWNENEIICKPKRCNVDDAITDKVSQVWSMTRDGLYLALEDNMVEHSKLVYMNCTDGYDLKNNDEETISMGNGTCNKGLLSLPFTCQQKSCEIPDVNHGRILSLTDNQQYVKHNEQLTIKCDPKYNIYNNDGTAVNELIATCDKGNWNEKAIICKPNACKGKKGQLDNGNIGFMMFKDSPSERREYICNRGYVMNVKASASGIRFHCSKRNGVWFWRRTFYTALSLSDVKCQKRAECSAPPTIENMEYNFIQRYRIKCSYTQPIQGYFSGDMYEYKCKPGYNQVSNTSTAVATTTDYNYTNYDHNYEYDVTEEGPVTCSSNGKWNHTVTDSCIAVTCDATQFVTISNGSINNYKDTYNYMEYLTLSCDPMYQPIDGIDFVYCNNNSMFEPQADFGCEEQRPQSKCALDATLPEDIEEQDCKGLYYGAYLNSRIEYKTMTSSLRIRSQFSMDFRTLDPNGVIFYYADTTHVKHISISINKGQVRYTFNCGTGLGEIVSPETYNDGKWHMLRIGRSLGEGSLEIDGELIATTQSPGRARSINGRPPFFFGGLDGRDLPDTGKNNLDGITNSFRGCIANIKLNDRDVGEPSVQNGTIKCSDLTEAGAYFYDDGGYLKQIDAFKVGLNLTLDIQIRPRSLDGVIFFVHGSKGDYVILQIVSGELWFTVDNGMGAFIAKYKPEINNKLCDGSWHSITAVKSKNVVVLTVDSNNPITTTIYGIATSADTYSPVYLGGIPDAITKGVKANGPYNGCMRRLSINGEYQYLTTCVAFSNVKLGMCPVY